MAIYTTSTAMKEGPESAYSAASNQVAVNLERLEDLVSNLHHRLTPVLSPGGGGKAEGSDTAISVAKAALVATLENHAARADRIADEVNDLLHRLCL